MRIGLIAALCPGEDGRLRAALPIAGRSVIAWQATLLRMLGVERVLCFTEAPGGPAVIALQHMLEAEGVQFHALKGFAALPGLVRAEDDLIIIRDGLVPDPAVVRAVLGGDDDGSAGGLTRAVATLPATHPLAASHPEDFERIDGQRHWAGVLAMRGAPVQQLADFPADADAVSVLLRLALQAGTPTSDLAARELVPETWLLADNAAVVEGHEAALIAHAAPPADWRRPGAALAAVLVRALVPRGLAQGATVAGAAALVLLLAGVMAAAFGFAAAGLALAACGTLSAQVARGFAALAARLERAVSEPRSAALLAVTSDAVTGIAAGFALAPLPDWQPLAALGPITVGLARLADRGEAMALIALVSDRFVLLASLALAAGFGVYPEALACLALGLLAALLLHRTAE